VGFPLSGPPDRTCIYMLTSNLSAMPGAQAPASALCLTATLVLARHQVSLLSQSEPSNIIIPLLTGIPDKRQVGFMCLKIRNKADNCQIASNFQIHTARADTKTRTPTAPTSSENTGHRKGAFFYIL
jgi:hypothetical protein